MRRDLESLLAEHLAAFPCVAVLGVRQSGKTTLLGSPPREWTVFELEHTSDVGARALRPLVDFVREQKARLGIVLNTDVAPRMLDDRIIGVPLNWL